MLIPIETLTKALPLAFWGIMIHLIIDWIFQTENMAKYKSDLTKGHGWIHALFHFAGMLLIFPFWWSLLIAIIHLVIDTRIPLNWWRTVYKQTTVGEMAIHVAIWQDQVVHWFVICVVALILASI